MRLSVQSDGDEHTPRPPPPIPRRRSDGIMTHFSFNVKMMFISIVIVVVDLCVCVRVRLWTRTARRSKKSRRRSNPCAAQDTVWVSSWGNGDGDGGSVFDLVALWWLWSRACWEPGELQPGSGATRGRQHGAGWSLHEVLRPR